MAQTDEIQFIPPNLQGRLRRWELVGVCVLVGLLVLTGLAYTTGLLEPKESPPAYHEVRFRPLVADLHGAVEYRPVGVGHWRPLRLSDVFEAGDQVRTGPKAACDVLLTWRTGFTIAPGTVLTWKTLATRGEARDVVLVLTQGKVLASLDALPKGSQFEVITPHSHTKIKGTVLVVETQEDVARTIVLRGVVEVVDRSDPTRLVTVTKDQVTAFGPAGKGVVEILSAERRAILLGEDARLRKSVDRLSPTADERQVAKGQVTFSAEEPEDAPARTTRVESASGGAGSGDRRADEEEIAGILLQGLTSLERGRTEEALGLCTKTFRALLWGALAERSGVAQELSREGGDGFILQQHDRIQATLQLEFEVLKISVSIDGDVAYGSVEVHVTATPVGENKQIQRIYACSARCVRQDGRWLIDLATAMEGRGAR